MAGDDLPEELPAVRALRTLSIFGADQKGAYREHFAQVSAALGEDVPTKLAAYARAWGEAGDPGVLILTGNAGTGKTAAAETWCRTAGAELPERDEVTELARGRILIKDLSGLPHPAARADAMRHALQLASTGQALVCANEGVLRDAAEALGAEGGALRPLLDEALRSGAASDAGITVANVNRQRPTADDIWDKLVNFVAREELGAGMRRLPRRWHGRHRMPFPRERAGTARGSAAAGPAAARAVRSGRGGPDNARGTRHPCLGDRWRLELL